MEIRIGDVPSAHNAVFVDTSEWADAVLHNTKGHERMTAYARGLLTSHRPLVTSNYVLTELLALVTSRGSNIPRAEVIQYIQGILSMPWLSVVHVDQDINQETWVLLQQSLDKAWSWVDVSSFVVMRRLGLTEAFTSDHHFLQAGFVRVPLDQ